MNTTFTTYAEKKAKQILNLLQGYTKGIQMTAILILLLMGVNNAWGAVVLRYQKDMPSGNYDGNTSKTMTQSSANSNRYYCEIELEANTSYGFFIINGSNYYKANVTATSNNSVQLTDYGSNNFGNSNHRVTYKSGTAGTYIFTYDASNHKICVSPKSSETIKIAYDVAQGHDGDWNLNNYVNLTQVGSTANYTIDLDLQATKYYMFVQISNGIYWRAGLTLTVNGSVPLYYYGTENYGGSGDKVNFTPTKAGKHRFIWNHSDKTLSVKPFYTVTFDANGHGTAPDAQTILSGTKATEPTAPTAPTATGYIFGGWYKESGCTNKYDFNTAVTDNLTLYAKWIPITVSATITPTEGTVGTNDLTFSITSNVPTNSGYWVGVYNFGEGEYAVGELNGITSYNNNPQTHTGTPNFAKAGTYYTRVFIMLNSIIQATSDKIAFIVNDGGTTPDPEELTWKMYDKTTELGIFTKQDENTYTLTIDVPENCNWLINYKYDQQYYTGAESLLQERTLVVGNGQVSWQDGAGTFTITIRKDGEQWKISAEKIINESTTVYFRPKTDWKNNNPVIICDGTTNAVTPYDCNGDYYTAEIPGGTTDLKFGGNNEQTLPLTVPTDNKVLYDMKSQTITALYLKPGDWDKDGAWFAVYLCNGEDDSSWHKMTKIEGTELYGVEIESSKLDPVKNKNVIFVRMNKDKSELSWDSKWNQSKDLDMPTNGTNQCTISDYWSNEKASGSWHKVWDNSCWKEFTAPTYDITLTSTPTTGGTIYVSKSSGITLNEPVTVTMTANPGYSFQSGTIKIGNQEEQTISTTESTHTICGPTTITATWDLNKYTVVFNKNADDASGSMEDQLFTYNEPQRLTANAFTRAGHKFAGWATTSDGEVEYTDAHEVSNLTAENGAEVILYAKWIQKYVIAGTGSGDMNWLNGHSWIDGDVTRLEDNVININEPKIYSNCSAGIKNFRIVRWGSDDQEHGIDQLDREKSSNIPFYTNEHNNISFVTIAKADITIGFDGTNITVNVEYDQDDLANVKDLIVSGENVMFYFGDEWSISDYKYVKDGEVNVVTATKGFLLNGVGADKWLSVAVLSSKEYYIHNSVNGANTGEAVRAGAIYACYGNNESMGITHGVTPTLGNASIRVGTANSGLTASPGGSSIGQAQTITDYYYKKEGESTWNKFDPNNVSDLPVGIYKVHALAHDGNIYVRTAEPATLTIYKQYYVQFNANGGEGNMEKQSFVYGETQALSANQFTREGHAFLGWSTTQNGEVVYGDKAEVTNLTPTNNATVNLYAQWLSQTPTYTINFDKQNGTNGTSSATVQYQNNNYNPATVVAPTRTDYTFGGYYTQAEGAGVQVVSAAGEWLKSVTGYTDASGNWIKNSGVTLYAKWISNSTSTEGLPTGVYLVGEVFNNWSAAPNQEFKKATESSTVYSLVVNLAEKKGYKFKVIDNGNWRGNSLENEFLTETNTSVILYKDGANNAECKITTTEAGEYIFTWDSETNTLSVEYPSDRVTVTFFGDGGTVGAVADDRVLTSPAKVKPGTSVTFTATPDANNAFSQWKKNGAVVSTDPTYTCAIDADATIEAVFLKPTTVFLKPNAQWKSDEARFAIYYWKSEQDNGWVDLKQLTCHDEYYTADVPVGYSQLQFVRMKPNSTNTQSNVWNRTTDLTLPTNGNNLYDLTKIYLKPNAEWKRDGARFAAYFFHSDFAEDKAWMSMLPTNETGVYYCDVPTDKLYNKVSFVRMKGEPSTNEWGNRLNQSKDIDLYNGSNFYTLEEGKWGKNETGGNDDNMNVIYSGKWTKLELPTITITNTTPDFGDVVVKTTGGRIITNGEKVPFDTKVIVTVTPKNGYKLKTATINETSLTVGTPNTICNNTTINVTFAIKEEWYVIGVDGDWETPQERFRFVDGQLEVELDTNITANFKIAYMQGTEILDRYGNKAFSISDKSHNLILANNKNGGDHCTIKTTYYGKYIFTWNAEQKILTITYPLSVGDYRLAYQDSEDGSFHPERVIKKCIIGDRLDTVSFFVHHDKSPRLVLQQCATLQNGVGTWQTIDDNIEFSVGSTGVWNFVLQQSNNPAHSVQVLTDDIKPYEGDYYIRTKSAKDGWTYFRSDSHKMTYSSYADNNEPFSHYFCKWVATDAEAANKTKNVRYTIANDYGDCISDTLAADPEDANPRIVTNANGDLPTNSANVRFGWDWKTNEIRRAYLAGSTGDSENTYLRLANGVALKNASNVSQTEIRFNDTENWIYQLDVIATKSTKVNLTALYNGSLQYFKGGPTMTNEQDDRIGLLSDDASSDITFNIRLVYDFKTNHLIVAWVPNNNGTYDGTLGANMMVIREHDYKNENGTVAVTQLNLQNEGLTNVDTVYAVMTFTQTWINKTPRTRDQSIYWVSFPFDVKLSDAFGFGEYADAWIIQYYDGAERAEKGLFSDSGTYWKYIFNPDGVVLKKGVGYVLVLDLDKIQFNHGVTSVSLYFPSSGEVGIITPDISTTVTVPAHKCEITTGSINHTITDSHWNLIGVPAFKDVTEFNTDKTLAPVYQQDSVSFYYEFLPNKSTYRANNNVTDFKAMYSYMVQFAGTINWNTKEAIKPAELAARRNSESELPEKISFRLEIAQDDVMADQTFVQLQQEGATADFDMNLDLTKIINSGANIYTLAGEQRIQSAGNALPMGEAVVPVGVKIATEGEYTFRMPDGTEGMVVELVDYETNTRTNLLLSDYIVTLPKGTHENRFALHIQPEKDVTTGVGNVGDETKGIEKYLIDGKLIIRTAEGIFDAQGHRL